MGDSLKSKLKPAPTRTTNQKTIILDMFIASTEEVESPRTIKSSTTTRNIMSLIVIYLPLSSLDYIR